ncbi:hypothetical protein KY495_02080 [Massilia sp. PAMC28688]|uniref:choice-of-anchor X domain-containing protein n=1 Tax=Massilia sp. PAMC28688 TaxID=2861283 RepID=UPI001C629859|nr:choice-of-anchor X domain-containing protein [Massilia sp. PAMC28688]QYF94048.1 hypothetical protein KY495_02080 [Massilia sp. PAMC28688]
MPSKGGWLGVAAGVLCAASVAWLANGEDGAVAASAAAPAPPGPGLPFLGEGPALAAPDAGARAARQRELREHFALVDQTYCHYATGTRYPPVSQPISQHPDQVYPNAPVTEAHPMRTSGSGSDASVLVQTSQSRVFMAAGESAAFSVRAVDKQGTVLPLVITRALAQGMTYQGTRATAQISLPFADDGSGADAVPGDGAYAGVLSPAQTGLAGFAGTIRTEVQYSVNGKRGFVLFDVIYSPELPATWTGQVREAVEEGSLVFYLKANVRQAGRYVVSGRVDDASGKPFAMATFNDLLPSGPAEVKLTVFGKLLRDAGPALPLKLRDIEGYLLKENVDPDRALMPRLEGTVMVSKPYPVKGFSDAEWQSEERERHLAEFSRDVKLARAALVKFDPQVPPPKSACMP